jgi:hypothetical protein
MIAVEQRSNDEAKEIVYLLIISLTPLPQDDELAVVYPRQVLIASWVC